MKDLPTRKNIRLKDYDYSQAGCYFITICIKDRHELLGTVVGAGSTRPLTELSENGQFIQNRITQIPLQYPTIHVDHYVVMPNHIHMILVLNEDGRVDPAPTIGNVIGWFKYQTTKEIGIRGVWQRSYHDHIIRNQGEYQKIWQYIDENPVTWTEDCYYVRK